MSPAGNQRLLVQRSADTNPAAPNERSPRWEPPCRLKGATPTKAGTRFLLDVPSTARSASIVMETTAGLKLATLCGNSFFSRHNRLLCMFCGRSPPEWLRSLLQPEIMGLHARMAFRDGTAGPIFFHHQNGNHLASVRQHGGEQLGISFAEGAPCHRPDCVTKVGQRMSIEPVGVGQWSSGLGEISTT